MAIPWLPREISSRLHEQPAERQNVQATYLLGTAWAGGFLAREDGKRPAWFNRVRLLSVTTLTPDLQEHLANACHVICLKVRQEVTSEPAKRAGRSDKPPTGWQGGLLCARVIWRALFAAAAAKGEVCKAGMPVLFMSVCEGLKLAANRLLVQLWNEVQLRFTSKAVKFRNIKSRPAWTVLEELQYKCFGERSGFGLRDPTETPPSSAGSKPAASLQDFLEEILALRFAVDWLTASLADAEEFIAQLTRRIQKRPAYKKGPPMAFVGTTFSSSTFGERTMLPTAASAAGSDNAVDSFGLMWTDDAELRGVAALAARLMDGLEGPSAQQFAATFAGQMLMALWKGVDPLLAHYASVSVARIAETHAVVGYLPPPILHEVDAERSHTAAYDRVSMSYEPPSKACRDILEQLPRSRLGHVIRAQAVFRGFIFRARYVARARTVAAYCKATKWPEGPPHAEEEDEDSQEKRKRRKRMQKVDPTRLKEEIETFKPTVSKYLGGEPAKPQPTTAGAFRGIGAPGLSMATSSWDAPTEVRRTWPMPTADHRACADLFALYLYNMYRRRELTRMWQTLCGSYERGMGVYAELLKMNPALQPMLESISAQLKRGATVGYDKAYVGKHAKGIQESETPSMTSRSAKPSKDGGPKLDPREDPASLLRTATLAPLPKLEPIQNEVSGDYLTAYLKEMDGDDSQFKDITAAVIPLSTGTSPPRKPPHEVVQAQLDDAETVGGVKPLLDVPFCMSKVRPMWLPIKAHRFAAYRAKVLGLLPQSQLQLYVEFEKQGMYLACIKVLENATPGSLNVLVPATLVNGKPLLVETVLQLIVGYSGLALKNKQGRVAVQLINQVVDNMSLSLRDLHPTHRTVLEAYLYDTALSVCYYMPNDLSMSERADSFFQQASERYLRLNHANRYCKCCLRAAAVLHNQGSHNEADYYTQKALNKLSDAPTCALLAVAYHNLAVHTLMEKKIADSVAHVRTYVNMLRQLPKLGNSWMQQMDTTQWLVLKAHELWPQYQIQAGIRDSQVMLSRVQR